MSGIVVITVGLVLQVSFDRVCLGVFTAALRGIVFPCLLALLAGFVITDEAEGVRIEAVVNDRVLTSLDVQRRAEVNAFFYKVSNTEGGRSEGVLQSLIDEAVLDYEAKDLGISIETQELNDEIARLFAIVGVCGDLGVHECAEHYGWHAESVISHVRSRIIWGKILSARIIPFITVSDGEISDYITEGKSQGLESVFDLQQVFIPFKSGMVLDSILSELNKSVTLDRIASRYREHGVYVDHTVGASASGFIPDVKAELLKAQSGSVIGPIKIDRGYLLVKLLSKVKVSRGFMNSVAEIRQVSLTASEADDVVRDLNARGVGCESFAVAVKDVGFESASLRVRVRDLSSRLQFMLESARLGEILRSDSEEKSDLIMLCGISESSGPSAEDMMKIRQNVYTEKLVLASGRLIESIKKRHYIKKL